MSRLVPSSKVTSKIHLAVVGAARRHVEHPLHAVDFLLDGRGHGGRHRFRIGARINGGHLDRRRGDFRILGVGEARQAPPGR